MLAADQLQILKTELADPQYAANVAAGYDLAIADQLNAPGAGTITLDVLAKGDVLLALIPSVAALATKDIATQQKWQLFLQMLFASDVLQITNANVQAVIGQAISDGLMTTDQAVALNQRPGSRAEILFGPGSVITTEDIARALRGG